MASVQLYAGSTEDAYDQVARVQCRASFSAVMSVSPDFIHLDKDYIGTWRRSTEAHGRHVYWLVLQQVQEYKSSRVQECKTTELTRPCLLRVEEGSDSDRGQWLVSAADSTSWTEAPFCGPFDNGMLCAELSRATSVCGDSNCVPPSHGPFRLDQQSLS